MVGQRCLQRADSLDGGFIQPERETPAIPLLSKARGAGTHPSPVGRRCCAARAWPLILPGSSVTHHRRYDGMNADNSSRSPARLKTRSTVLLVGLAAMLIAGAWGLHQQQTRSWSSVNGHVI